MFPNTDLAQESVVQIDLRGFLNKAENLLERAIDAFHDRANFPDWLLLHGCYLIESTL